MQFWRYDLEEAIGWMNSMWWSASSRPVLLVVGGVAIAVTLIESLAMR
jgi:hypothetical protein